MSCRYGKQAYRQSGAVSYRAFPASNATCSMCRTLASASVADSSTTARCTPLTAPYCARAPALKDALTGSERRCRRQNPAFKWHASCKHAASTPCCHCHIAMGAASATLASLRKSAEVDASEPHPGAASCLPAVWARVRGPAPRRQQSLPGFLQ